MSLIQIAEFRPPPPFFFYVFHHTEARLLVLVLLPTVVCKVCFALVSMHPTPLPPQPCVPSPLLRWRGWTAAPRRRTAGGGCRWWASALSWPGLSERWYSSYRRRGDAAGEGGRRQSASPQVNVLSGRLILRSVALVAIFHLLARATTVSWLSPGRRTTPEVKLREPGSKQKHRVTDRRLELQRSSTSSRCLCIYCLEKIFALPQINLNQLMWQNKAVQRFLITESTVITSKILVLSVIEPKDRSEYWKRTKNKQSDSCHFSSLLTTGRWMERITVRTLSLDTFTALLNFSLRVWIPCIPSYIYSNLRPLIVIGNPPESI